MNHDQPLVISLLPRQFRIGQAPNFAELAEIVYSWPNTEYCAIEDVLAHSSDLDQYFESRFGQIPKAIVVFEPWDPALFQCLSSCASKIVLITEDLHLRPLPLLRTAVHIASLVLARFDIIGDLLGEDLPHVLPFPLHCSQVFLSEPNALSENQLIHFGNLETDPPNIDPARSPGANQYGYRKDWHHLLTQKAGEHYLYTRLPPDDLREAMLKRSFGFSCTYFPYSFSAECAAEQGEDWSRINQPHDASQSYFVAKFLEIPGSGLLMLADPAGVDRFLDDAGFVDRENFVAFRRETIEETLNFVFDSRNAEKLLEIRHNGYELVRRRHTLEVRKREFRDHLKNLLTI